MELKNLTISDIRPAVMERIRPALASLGFSDDISLAPSPKPDMGDLGFPCFPFAKIARKAPPAIAEEIAGLIEPDELIGEIVAVGPYVNFRFRPNAIIQIVLGQVLREGSRFGENTLPEEERAHWVIEYSAPNTNKPQHLGHARNNVLGLSVSRILEFAGHTLTRVNLINDRGIHICKSMLAYQRWGAGDTPESTGIKGDHFVGRWYVRFDKELKEEYGAWLETSEAQDAYGRWQKSRAGMAALAAQKEGKGGDPWKAFTKDHQPAYFNESSELGREAKAMLIRWEESDEETVALWKRMNQWVFDGFDATYERMGVQFDKVYYESETYLLGKDIVEQGLEDGVFSTLEDGAVVFDLERIGKQGQKVLLRGDGTTVYMTQDLGTALSRFDGLGMDKMAYVVADEQAYHFEVLFGILGVLRPTLENACQHLSYGMVHLPEGKMKSREGTVVDTDDLMDGMRDLALEEIRRRDATAAEKNPDYTPLAEEEMIRRAEGIGQGALKYYLLHFTPPATVSFDPQKSIDFLGQTGPYCMYAYARVQSLLRRSSLEINPENFNEEVAAKLGSDLELAVIRELQAFPVAIAYAASHYDTSKIADQTYRIAKTFSTFYNDRNHHIIGNEDPALEQARLLLAKAVSSTVQIGLTLLGISTLEQM